MAASPWRIVAVALTIGLTIWIWALASVLLVLRWSSIERLPPPEKPLFIYGEMRVGVDASYPPFAVATDTDLFGLDIDLGTALAARLNIPVRFVNMGYDGLYDSLKADQVDVVISALLVDSSRLADVRYTRSYFNAGLVLVSAGREPIDGMQDLSDHALAFEYASDADLEARSWLRRVLPFTTLPYELPEYALDAVRLGSADAALVDATSALLYLRDHRDWQAQYRYITDAWYAAAVRADRVEMWSAINRALHSLADDGTLDAIMAKWL